MNLRYALPIITMVTLCTAATGPQSQMPDNGLSQYWRTEKKVSELDWNLLQFNLLWHDSYGSGEYVKSSPVWFDEGSMTFRTRLRVADKRDYRDPEPWFSLPAPKQTAILQGVADHLVQLLRPNFPKVKEIQDTVDITFVYHASDGTGSSTVATYRKGHLELAPR